MRAPLAGILANVKVYSSTDLMGDWVVACTGAVARLALLTSSLYTQWTMADNRQQSNLNSKVANSMCVCFV